MPQAPDHAADQSRPGLAQRHQLGQQVAAPAQLLAKAKEPVDRRADDQAAQEGGQQKDAGRRQRGRIGTRRDHEPVETGQLPVGIPQAERPGQQVGGDKGQRHHDGRGQVRLPRAEAKVGDAKALARHKLDGHDRGQRGNPHHRGDDHLRDDDRLVCEAKAGQDHGTLDGVGQAKGDGQVRDQSLPVEHRSNPPCGWLLISCQDLRGFTR